MAGYTIDAIVQSYDLKTDGTRTDVMRVSFATDAGDSGQVTVPLVSGWSEQARAEIQAMVDDMNNLRGG